MNRTISQFISIIGHPLLMVTYGFLILLWINPFPFGVRDMQDKNAVILIIQVFATTFFIPGAGVALMKPLGLIQSLEMQDKQERIGPYIITGIFYLWMFKNFYSQGQMPLLFTRFMLGATIGLFLAFFINIFSKISAASFEWGGGIGAIPIMGGVLMLSLNTILCIVLVFAGLVGVARLALGAHVPIDLYRGFAVGVFSQVAASGLI
jgi:hypothetical protein